MRRSQRLHALTWVVIGLVFGTGMSLIPSPRSPHVFWIGNLCAPWLVVTFFAGRSRRTPGGALVAGLLAEVACVIGFYAPFLFLGPASMGLPRNTPLLQYVVPDLRAWLHFIAFWIVIAVASGAIYGLLGQWWKRSAPAAAALAVGVPFLAEPGLWTLKDREFRGPVTLWLLEAGVGLALTTLLIRRRPVLPVQ